MNESSGIFSSLNFVYCVAFAVQQILEADFKRVGFPVFKQQKTAKLQ
jgi:hypothetical protein